MKENKEQDRAIRRLLWGRKGERVSKKAREREFSVEEVLEFLKKKQGSGEKR